MAGALRFLNGIRPFIDQGVGPFAQQDPLQRGQMPDPSGMMASESQGAPPIGVGPGPSAPVRMPQLSEDAAEVAGNSLLRGASASADDMASSSNGIGLMGTLGIINAGAGLGGMLFKMLTAKKPPRPVQSVQGGGGNPFK